MRVLAIVQTWNCEDPIRGFTVRWMEKLAGKVDKLIILALEQQHLSTHSNIEIYSLGKEHTKRIGRRFRYLMRWHQCMIRIMREYKLQVVFTHMTPIFTVLIAPYAKASGIPIVTWYAHRQVTTILKMAHYLSSRIVSINKDSYRYQHDKFVPLGHGIDVDFFSPDGTKPENPPLLLSVGRLSPIKDLITLIEAVRRLRERGYDVYCTLVGNAPERDRTYAEQVKNAIGHLGLDKVVQLIGAVPQEQIVSWYRRCFVHVNCAPADHSLDKAVLEAMACGKPSLSSALSFRETMGQCADWLLFQHGNPEDLAKQVERLLQLSSIDRQAIGAELRQSVVERHSLERLTHQLVNVFQELAK